MDSSLFPFERSRQCGWLGGVLAIVFFGVVLALLADEELGGSGSSSEAEADAFAKGQARLDALTAELNHLQAMEREQAAKLEALEELKPLIQSLVRGTLEEEELAVRLAAQQRAVEELAAEQDRYAEAVRQQLWKQAEGRRLKELTTQAGKTYRSVEITEVRPDVLALTHAEGSVALPVVLLPGSLRRELQLDLAESQRLLREQREKEWAATRERLRKRQAAQEARERAALPEPEKEADRPDEDLVLWSLQQKNQVLTDRLLRLRGDLEEASRKAAFSSNRSVPGSLETWVERQARLRFLQQRLRAQLQDTRRRILAIAPGERFPVLP